MAKSQLFARPMQWVYTHGGVFPVRRGYRDEEAFITANSILERGGLIVMYCEGGRSRTGKLSEQPKRGIGRLALESGATIVPAAIHGSSKVRNWKRLQFPKVTVQYGEPMRWEAVEEPDRRPAAAGRERDLRPDPRPLCGAGLARPQGRRAAAARGARTRPAAPALPPDVLAARRDLRRSASANTTSVPGPQSTRSTAPSTSEMRSSPSPPWIVSPSWVPEIDVVAGAAVDLVDAVAALDRVVALVAEHDVVAEAAEHLVVVGAAVEDVVAVLAVDVVGRLVAEQLVVAVLAEQRVGRGGAEQGVVAGGAADDRRRRRVGGRLGRDLDDLLAAREARRGSGAVLST